MMDSARAVAATCGDRNPCVRIGASTMNIATLSALAFAAVAAGAIGFQLALALGAPWGAYAMGGRFPGRFPQPMRVAAVVQAAVIALLAAVVLARAGLAPGPMASWAIWVVVGFSGLSLAMNAISPSAGERRIWVPVAVVMLASSLVVALVAG